MPPKASPFEKVPMELLRHMFRNLPNEDLHSVALTCKSFAVVATPLLYREFSHRLNVHDMYELKKIWEPVVLRNLDRSPQEIRNYVEGVHIWFWDRVCRRLKPELASTVRLYVTCYNDERETYDAIRYLMNAMFQKLQPGRVLSLETGRL
ncbi:hypothetical protein TWF696_005691 [Orbilia brochopaga]|uniref:F-box domain-containing protein n=1 Tax=Orbilia brochopaga TaxID=3140254 RepID=A0AAV9V0F6_9PEZI